MRGSRSSCCFWPERRFSCEPSTASSLFCRVRRWHRFPLELKSWAGTDIPIPAETLKSLGTGEFLQRMYKDPVNGGAYVDLYVAYIPDQHALFRHLPQVCLEGSGWSPVESGTTTLAFPGDTPFSCQSLRDCQRRRSSTSPVLVLGPRPSGGQPRTG